MFCYVVQIFVCSSEIVSRITALNASGQQLVSVLVQLPLWWLSRLDQDSLELVCVSLPSCLFLKD